MKLLNNNRTFGLRIKTGALIALLFGILIASSGCGQKGSLYLPNKAKAAYAAQPQNNGS